MTMWQDLDGFDDYEISTEYPYDIRKKGKSNVLKGEYNHAGYRRVRIHGQNYLFHRLVANQFMKNKDPTKTQIDHINHDRTDNHIENLRWVSRRENALNRTGNKFYKWDEVETLPTDAIVFNKYNSHELENYYYSQSDDTFYLFNGVKYRKLIKCYKNNSPCVHVMTIDRISICVYLSKFKKLYNVN